MADLLSALIREALLCAAQHGRRTALAPDAVTAGDAQEHRCGSSAE